MAASYELDRAPENVALVIAERRARDKATQDAVVARNNAFRNNERTVVKTFEAVCEDVANGSLAVKAIKAHGVSPATFYRYVYEDPERLKAWGEARIIGSHAMAEEVVSLADDARKAKRLKPVTLAAATLQVNGRKWLTARVNPRAYGDKLDVTTEGKAITGVVLLPPLDHAP